MRPKNHVSKALLKVTASFLWFGFGLAVYIEAMIQDILGRERFLQFASSHWVSLPWWLWLIPISITVLNIWKQWKEWLTNG